MAKFNFTDIRYTVAGEPGQTRLADDRILDLPEGQGTVRFMRESLAAEGSTRVENLSYTSKRA